MLRTGVTWCSIRVDHKKIFSYLGFIDERIRTFDKDYPLSNGITGCPIDLDPLSKNWTGTTLTFTKTQKLRIFLHVKRNFRKQIFFLLEDTSTPWDFLWGTKGKKCAHFLIFRNGKMAPAKFFNVGRYWKHISSEKLENCCWNWVKITGTPYI